DGPRVIQVTGNMEANSANALKLAAALGQGLIWMPDFLVRDDIESGRLVSVLTEFSCTEMAINAVYSHRAHLATNVRSFLDLVTRHVHAASRDALSRALDLPPGLIARNGAVPSVRLDA